MRKNKYNAKKSGYGGRIYDSNLEKKYARNLDWRLKAKDIKSWTTQHRFDLRINGAHWRFYKIDFRVENNDGSFDYVEIKGFPTVEWKQKWDITIILFDQLTEGETARLYLNEKLIKKSY